MKTWWGLVVVGSLLPLHAAAASEADCDERCAENVTGGVTGGIATLARGGLANGKRASSVAGAALDVAFVGSGKSRGGATMSLEEGITGANEYRGGSHHAYWDGRLGLLFARGAPWTDDTFGFSVATGAALGTRPGPSRAGGLVPNSIACDTGSGCGPYLEPAQPNRYLNAFAEARFVAQLPLRGEWHPFVGASGSWVLSQFGESVQRASLDVGVAWLGW